MACDGYKNNALMGNWYEDRIGVPQAYQTNKDFRTTREEEEAISYISRNNLLMPLGRVERVHAWDTKGVIADDGFQEYKTTNKTFYDPTLIKNYQGYQDCRPTVKVGEQRKAYPENHTSIQTSQAKNFALLTKTNMQLQAYETNRDVKMNITDFGSTFKKHGPEHERFYNMTTYQQHFDRTPQPTAEEVITNDLKKLTSFAGYNSRPDNLKGPKMVSAMTGEVYKTERDPQQNTLVQRSWLPYVENSIQVAEGNMQKSQQINTSTGFKSTDKLANYKQNNDQTLPYDIATSLPMADGMHALKNKYMEPGSFRKIRSDVTFTRNKPLTKK